MGTCGVVVSSISAALGVILIGLGVGLSFYFKTLIIHKVDDQVPIKNGTESFKSWVSPPTPVYMQYYLFDVKNPDEIVKDGAKPIVEQIGPYTYRESRVKENITFNANGTVSYVEPKYFIFEPSLSVGSENDNFTTVNIPMLVLAYKMEKLLTKFPELKDEGMEILQDFFDSVGKETLYINLTVEDLLWGYDEPMFVMYDWLKKELGFIAKLLHLPHIDKKFGLFYKGSSGSGNGSDDGVYTVYTGTKDVSRLNEIYQWNGTSTLSYWNSSLCNMINGTDGSQYHPFLKKTEIIRLFSTDICRSIYATFEKETSIDSIRLFRFTAPRSVFEDHRHNPYNTGFCVPTCLGAGVLNLEVCKGGAPLVASSPHFYQADPDYINAITGIHPVKEQHETFLDMEPYTGIGMHLSKKLQLNMMIRKVDKIRDTMRFENFTIFPLLWVNESALIDKASADRFKKEVYTPIQMTIIIQYSLIAFGAFLIFCVLMYLLARVINRSKQDTGNIQVAADGDTRGLLGDGDTANKT